MNIKITSNNIILTIQLPQVFSETDFNNQTL